MAQKSVIIFVLSLLMVCPVRSQILLGLQTGASFNCLKTDISNRAATEINPQGGYNISLLVQYQLCNWLFVKISPDIIQKNYSIDRRGSLQGVYSQFNNTYFQLPLSAHFIYGKRVQIFGDVGGYIGYWSRGRLKGRTPNIFSVSITDNVVTGQHTENFKLTAFDQNYIFNSLRDQRLELGWLAGIGLQYRLKKKYNIFCECLQYRAITDQQKRYMINQIPQYNQTFVFSFGGLYLLK